MVAFSNYFFHYFKGRWVSKKSLQIVQDSFRWQVNEKSFWKSRPRGSVEDIENLANQQHDVWIQEMNEPN